MSRDILTVLGSSSGLPQADRATSGYLLKTGHSLSLIDCGGGITSSFLRRGFNPLDVDRIFISHTHPDHVCELPLFIQLIYLRGREKPLEVFVPDEFVAPLKGYLPAVYILENKLPFELRITGYEHGFVFDEDFRLEAIGNSHLHPYREFIESAGLPNKMQCHSFKIQVNGRSVLYSADIGSFDDLRDHLEGTDIVIIESTHLDLDQFLKFAQTAKVGRYILTHLGSKEDVAEINLRAAKAVVDNLTTAVDGMEIEL